MTQKVILDTDIGDDIDDALALGLILASPELELLGVTTVFKNVAARAAQARTILQAAGRAGVPVAAGCGAVLSPRVTYPGEARRAYLEGELPNQHAMSLPGGRAAAAGPAPRRRFPHRHDHGRGGRYHHRHHRRDDQPGHGHGQGAAHHRPACRASSPWPPRSTGWSQRVEHPLRPGSRGHRAGERRAHAHHRPGRDDEGAVPAQGYRGPAGQPPAAGAARWRAASPPGKRRAAGRTRCSGLPIMHDPLAVATIIDPGVVQWRRGTAAVELQGSGSYGYTLFHQDPAGPARACLPGQRRRRSRPVDR